MFDRSRTPPRAFGVVARNVEAVGFVLSCLKGLTMLHDLTQTTVLEQAKFQIPGLRLLDVVNALNSRAVYACDRIRPADRECEMEVRRALNGAFCHNNESCSSGVGRASPV